MGTTTELQERAAELQRIVSTPTEREQAADELAQVEQQLAEQRAAEAKAAAQQRLVGISRAYGSLRASMDMDVERIRAKLQELGAAITTANERYEKLVELQLEARDLSVDHALAVPTLSRLVPPAEVFKAARPQADPRLLTLDDDVRLRRVHAKQRERAGKA